MDRSTAEKLAVLFLDVLDRNARDELVRCFNAGSFGWILQPRYAGDPYPDFVMGYEVFEVTE
jgi:hypothetical protein